jgi:cell division protein FtsQ
VSVMTSRRVPDPAGPIEAQPRRWRRWLAGILAMAVVVGLVWIVAFSPVLSARSVKVEGVQRLTSAQVIDAAQVPIGTPLVRISRGDIAGRVEQLAQVRSARVELSFPSTVVIAVTERVAAAYGLAAHGGYTYVDATGRTFDNMSTAPTGLPLLSPANDVLADPATLAAMAQIASALPTQVRSLVKAITATAADDVDLQLADGRTVVWGGSDRNADKIRILPALLRRPGHVFDISNPDQVFTH